MAFERGQSSRRVSRVGGFEALADSWQLAAAAIVPDAHAHRTRQVCLLLEQTAGSQLDITTRHLFSV